MELVLGSSFNLLVFSCFEGKGHELHIDLPFNEPSSSPRVPLGQHFPPRSQLIGAAVVLGCGGRCSVVQLCYKPQGRNQHFSLPSEGFLRYLLPVELKSFGA